MTNPQEPREWPKDSIQDINGEWYVHHDKYDQARLDFDKLKGHYDQLAKERDALKAELDIMDKNFIETKERLQEAEGLIDYIATDGDHGTCHEDNVYRCKVYIAKNAVQESGIEGLGLFDEQYGSPKKE